jgi:hypothetical protein
MQELSTLFIILVMKSYQLFQCHLVEEEFFFFCQHKERTETKQGDKKGVQNLSI